MVRYNKHIIGNYVCFIYLVIVRFNIIGKPSCPWCDIISELLAITWLSCIDAKNFFLGVVGVGGLGQIVANELDKS